MPLRDLDAFPNFYGTSAAAPHAAGVAALVLQAQWRARAPSPSRKCAPSCNAAASSTISISSIPSARRGRAMAARSRSPRVGTTGTSTLRWTRDLHGRLEFVRSSYVGPGSINSLSINLSAANTTGGSELGAVPGIVWDMRARSTAALPDSPSPWAPRSAGSSRQYHPRLFHASAGARGRGSIPAVGSDLRGGHLHRWPWLYLRCRPRRASHAEHHRPPPTGFGNSGDLLGATVAIPAGTVVPGGATFSGLDSNGNPFSGTISNKIGKGYSPLGWLRLHQRAGRSQPAAAVSNHLGASTNGRARDSGRGRFSF